MHSSHMDWNRRLGRAWLIAWASTCLHAMHWIEAEEPDPPPKAEPYHPIANKPYCIKKQCFHPNTEIKKFKASGIASWYGYPFHGRKTSSGERYNMYAYTAASTSLPIPSYAKVTNLSNQKSIVVRINDRGPFIGGRILDMSFGAAHHLGFTDRGTAHVHVEWIHPEKIAKYKHKQASMARSTSNRTPTSHHKTSTQTTSHAYIQIAFFKKALFAEKFTNQLKQQYPHLPIDMRQHTKGFHIRIGPLPRSMTPETLELIQKNYKQAFVL